MKKKFKDTKTGAFLKKTVPDIFELAADLTGIEALDKVSALIEGDTTIDEIKKEAVKNQIEATKEMMKIAVENTQGAREMQIAALNKGDLFSKRYTYYLSAFIILSAVSFGILLAFKEIPENNIHIFQLFADTFLIAGGLTIINFFFGNKIS